MQQGTQPTIGDRPSSDPHCKWCDRAKDSYIGDWHGKVLLQGSLAAALLQLQNASMHSSAMLRSMMQTAIWHRSHHESTHMDTHGRLQCNGGHKQLLASMQTVR